MKKSFFFYTSGFIMLLFILNSCRNEEFIAKHNSSEHQKSFISFKEFFSKTKISNEILRSNISAKNISVDGFILDTAKIRVTLENGNETAYSFVASPTFTEENNSKDVFYNLAVVKSNNQWNINLFKFETEKGWINNVNVNSNILHPFNGEISLINSNIQFSRSTTCGFSVTPYFYCKSDHTPDCSLGDCDDCYKYKAEYTPCPVEGGGSGETGGSATGGGTDGTSPTGNGFDVNLPTITGNSDCDKAANATANANALINYANVKQKLDSLSNYAITKNVEYAVTISKQIGETFPEASNPYTQNYSGQVTIYIPTNGDFIADAHSHNIGGSPAPSPGDFYSAMKSAVEHGTFSASLVYAFEGSVYAFMVNNRQNAQTFLANYPRNTNVSANGQEIIGSSAMAIKFNEILGKFSSGLFPSYSGNSQKDGLETAMAWVLNKFNSGMSIAKMDENGNFKALTAKTFNYYDIAGLQNITAYKTEICP